MTERPDTDTPSPWEATRVDEGDAVGARAAGSGWAAAEETASLTDAPAAGAETSAPVTPLVEPEPEPDPKPAAPPVLDPSRDPGPAPVPTGFPSSAPSAAPHTGVSTSDGDLATDRPEVVIGGAFAGGLVLGLILKHLGN